MIEKPAPADRRRTGKAITTGDFAILAIVVLVFLGVTILGCAVLWDALNPSEWTAAGWAAAGSWFAGTGTLAAVGVALWQSRQARADARQAIHEADRLHREQLREEVLRSGIATTTALLPEVRAFILRMPMTDSDFAMCEFDAESPAGIPGTAGRSHDPGTAGYALEVLRRFDDPQEMARTLLTNLRVARFQVRVPVLRDALDEAQRLVDLIGQQIRIWSHQAATGQAQSAPLEEIRAITVEGRLQGGELFAVARHVEQLIETALDKVPLDDHWSSTVDEGDATMTP